MNKINPLFFETEEVRIKLFQNVKFKLQFRSLNCTKSFGKYLYDYEQLWPFFNYRMLLWPVLPLPKIALSF
jgi:hypothetical protein